MLIRSPLTTVVPFLICAVFLRCLQADSDAVSTVKDGSATDSDDPYLYADGSLDTLLGVLYGRCLPAVDSAFQWPSEASWETREHNGIWKSLFSHKSDGFSLAISETRRFDPRSRGIARAESDRTILNINGRQFRMGDLIYQNSRDTVSDSWDFSNGWEKYTLNGKAYFITKQNIPGCNGSFCRLTCTALVDLNGPEPEMFFFESSTWYSELTDIDCDGKLEWMDVTIGSSYYFSDTIHLYLSPFELTGNKAFVPIQNTNHARCSAEIMMVNGYYEPRQARLVRKNWP